MTRPLRRGTSKVVPIVVSAGLAVGVFCGLLFGIGKKSEAVAAPSETGSNGLGAATPAGEPPATATAPPIAPPATTPPPTTPPPTTPPATGSAGSAAGAAAASAAPTVPPAKLTRLTVTIKPDAAAAEARLIVDGTPVDSMLVELPADKKSVRLEVKSSGYRSIDKKIDIAGGDTAIELEMAKRSGGTGTPQVRPPKRPDKPPGSSSGGGLIDI